MSMQLQTIQERTEKYDQLIVLGREAYKRGEIQRAHRFWQSASMIRSDDEMLWQLLLSVVEAKDDRIICLTNILTLNPENYLAEKMLRAILHEELPGVLDD